MRARKNHAILSRDRPNHRTPCLFSDRSRGYIDLLTPYMTMTSNYRNGVTNLDKFGLLADANLLALIF
jgi:hypothetical protein